MDNIFDFFSDIDLNTGDTFEYAKLGFGVGFICIIFSIIILILISSDYYSASTVYGMLIVGVLLTLPMVFMISSEYIYQRKEKKENTKLPIKL